MIDIPPVLADFLLPFLFLSGLGFIAAFFKSRWFKGWMGEKLVSFALSMRLSKRKYHLINNVTLPTEAGTTQIDHILISRFGLFVIETKNMTGWIFGSARQRQWTQKVYKKSYQFQNPLHQNDRHTKALARCLKVRNKVFHSVVVFVGDSVFKTQMPENVIHASRLIRFVKARKEVVYSDGQVQKLVQQLAACRLAPTLKTRRQHIRHVRS
ncbi:MAG: nuclease-related domain-containing protein, partial [Kistimonas sp.]|nr:nuclease-related domain-containing protein [Kistimonas sp.]